MWNIDFKNGNHCEEKKNFSISIESIEFISVLRIYLTITLLHKCNRDIL